MSLQYPLGLLGLLAIPLLILIYVLKNKHTEQVIASTYLWTLSERFLKRKNPISRLAGIISLILQILAVTFISLSIAQPIFTLKNAARDYVFILDGSGSMAYESKGKTRFELAKEEIEDIVKDSVSGSTYTLIYAGDSTSVLFEGVADKLHALSLLGEAELTASSSSLKESQGLAQSYFNENPAAKIYLLSDKAYESVENVEVINLSAKVENYALSPLTCTVEEGRLAVSGEACSYESDRELTLDLEVNRGGQVLREEQKLAVAKWEDEQSAQPFTFLVEGNTYDSVKVSIREGDALPQDNVSMLYSASERKKGDILIVSDNNEFFLRSAIQALPNAPKITSVKGEEYDQATTGYGLYIFDSYKPEILPDGEVWFINPKTSLTGAGFTVQGSFDLPKPHALTYSSSTASRVVSILKNTLKSDISIRQYVKCSFDRNFSTILSYDGNPLLFAGVNDENNRQVVFAFDFNRSDFVLNVNFVTLIRNLLDYTFPSMVDSTTQVCGESLAINILGDNRSVRVETPSGKIATLGAEGDLVEYTMKEVGTYKITQIIEDREESVYVYGLLSAMESRPQQSEDAFAVVGAPSSERRDGWYDDLVVWFVLLGLIFLADWGVYCYEQHQLR